MDWKNIYDRGIIHEGNLYRMKTVMEKAAEGKPVAVGFIGGSITMGSLSSTPETCYAYLVYKWWKEKFPEADISYRNAGIGATTSQFAAARAECDLLQYAADVVFAEFSVNDENNSFFQETFEGLLRRILESESRPALFMFNNVQYDTGHNAQQVHNEVGKYYDLPIVSMKESIYEEIRAGHQELCSITADNLHPNDKGHRLVAAVITNLLDIIYHKVFTEKTDCSSYHLPETPLTPNRYMMSVRHNIMNCSPELDGFEPDNAVQNGITDVFKNGWSAKTKGAGITFRVTASRISLQYRKTIRHPAPAAKLRIDSKEVPDILLRADFEETWGDCLYLQDIATFDSTAVHTVEIILSDIPEGCAADFYIASLITA